MLKDPKRCISIFVRFFYYSEGKSVRKNSVLVGSEISRLFVDILTPDDKYFLTVKASV